MHTEQTKLKRDVLKIEYVRQFFFLHIYMILLIHSYVETKTYNFRFSFFFCFIRPKNIWGSFFFGVMTLIHIHIVWRGWQCVRQKFYDFFQYFAATIH